MVVAKGSGIFEAVRENLTYWLLFGISCAALYFAADWLIPWMFGSDFQSSVSALHILMLGVLGGAALGSALQSSKVPDFARCLRWVPRSPSESQFSVSGTIGER